jgi:hypothetical protein
MASTAPTNYTARESLNNTRLDRTKIFEDGDAEIAHGDATISGNGSVKGEVSEENLKQPPTTRGAVLSRVLETQ